MTAKGTRLAQVALVLGLATGGTASRGEAPEIALRFMGSVPIGKGAHGLREASGLAVASNGAELLAVDDGSGRIVFLSPDGPVKDQAAIETGLADIEGLTLRPDGTILMVQEGSGSLIVAASDGSQQEAYPLSEMAGFDRTDPAFSGEGSNDGLEGVAIRATDGTIFVLKERNPRLLVAISPNLTTILSATELTAALGFQSDVAGDHKLDLADLAHDPARGGFWLVSDTGSALYFLPDAGGPARVWPLANGTDRIFSAEGVALSADGRTLWIVTDAGKDSQLYTFALYP